jgi:LmbE family N-acetylglucosaminyl deacetylase
VELSAMFGQRILLLIPHPDDEVVGCCAAIGRAQRAGANVFGAFLTTGVPAAEVLWPWQRAAHHQRVEQRLGEARRAAELLGLDPICFRDVPTRRLKDHGPATLELIRSLLAEVHADMLWTPAYEGGHQDHDVANFLASRLRDRAPVWEFSEYNFFGGEVRSQEFFAPTGEEQVLALDAAEQQRKRTLLALYASEQGNLDYVRTAREVFRPLASYDYTRPPHDGKMFYQRFQWVPYHPRVDHTRPEEVCRALAGFAAHS